MIEKDVKRITVGKHPISVVGLGRALEEIAGPCADKSDEEIGAALLERLGKDNYIPSSAKGEYAKAFVREFHRFIGREVEEEGPREGLDIKVLGAGCNQCDKLTQTVLDVLNETGVPASVEHVTEMREIARYGVMGVPALLINGKVISVGSVPPRHKVKVWIEQAGASFKA